MTVHDDAQATLDLLHRKGWWKQGLDNDEDGENCLAMATGLHGSIDLDVAIAAIVAAEFPSRAPSGLHPTHVIIEFNDHPDTVFADVETVLEKVAASEVTS